MPGNSNFIQCFEGAPLPNGGSNPVAFLAGISLIPTGAKTARERAAKFKAFR